MKRRRTTDRPLAAGTINPAEDRSRHILVVSASMGAGHDGAARELAARLRERGHTAEVRDFLDAGPLGIGKLLKRVYEFELRHVPSAYDATYRLWYRAPWLTPVVTSLVTALTRRKLLRWVKRLDADVVVSTYPLSTLCLGRLRRIGELRVPSVNFITDFGVHPLWVHPGNDLNLAVHAGPARLAHLRTGRPSVACGPVVSRAYEPCDEQATVRDEARRNWGLADDEKAVLVVAGSWGVGGIRETFDAIAGDGRFTPVVVCGQDQATRRELTKRARRYATRSIVVGWTDEMPSLMAACDALVENAGGLTSLEAMRAGLPVVSFRPIAGHGVENTSTMAAMGVSRLAQDIPQLLHSLDQLCAGGPARSAQIDAARAMFISDPASLALSAAEMVAPTTAGRAGVRVALRAAAAVAGLAGLAWTGLTTGVGVAAAAGAGVAHPQQDFSDVAYLGVRLDRAQLADPSLRRELTQLDITAVVDEPTAKSDPSALRRLAASGVDVANGGLGRVRQGSIDPPAAWNRAAGDLAAGRQLGRILGQHVGEFVPANGVNAFDLVDSGHAHAQIVVPNQTWNALGNSDPLQIKGRTIYLVDGLAVSPARVEGVLRHLSGSFTASHLVVAPFSALQ